MTLQVAEHFFQVVQRPRFGELPSIVRLLAVMRCAIHNDETLLTRCKRNIEMTPLCKIEVTLPRVVGSREVRRGGVVDEQAGIQPS